MELEKTEPENRDRATRFPVVQSFVCAMSHGLLGRCDRRVELHHVGLCSSTSGQQHENRETGDEQKTFSHSDRVLRRSC